MTEKEMKQIEKEHKRVLKEQKRYYKMMKIQERHNLKIQRELKKRNK